ncbi:Hint domain-containing protein [Aestuariibius insulae]|uniref:Hint domain-containing protein n=1 Tax=Aestuariibius insulae TaxID=2058287 RepID=UPI00345E2871
MPNYTIYVLDEADITLTNSDGTAENLDGVNQGDGSHLVGDTLTLGGSNWMPTEISDDDANFSDNDTRGTTAQTLVNETSLDGSTFSAGSKVEAEYSFVVTDGTFDSEGNPVTWTLVGFNIATTNPSYGTVEGLAFIGGPGGFPPVGVPLTVVSAAEGPNFPAADYATPICFGAGTLIETERGPMPIEEIEVGMRVRTRDNGFQTVRWHGVRRFAAIGSMAPIVFKPGVIGNERELVLSPQHRVRVSGWKAELLFGEIEALVPAVHFLNDDTVTRRLGGTVEYHHLMFDRHQIIFAEGAEAESLHPGIRTLDKLDAAARAELLEIFSEIAEVEGAYGPSVHPSLKGFEARAFLA